MLKSLEMHWPVPIARTGDAAMISGYLGQSNKFDLAITALAMTHAQQVEQDYYALERSSRDG